MSTTQKYKVTERYSAGWTDPRGVFFSDSPAFSGAPDIEILAQISSMSTDTLEGLWSMRFKEEPTAFEIQSEPFFYALAYKWWNERKLARIKGTSAEPKYKVQDPDARNYDFDTDTQMPRPWAKNIPAEIRAIDTSVLVQLWLIRFPEPPGPDEVKQASDFYYQASRELWVRKRLTKERFDDDVAGRYPAYKVVFVVRPEGECKS